MLVGDLANVGEGGLAVGSGEGGVEGVEGLMVVRREVAIGGEGDDGGEGGGGLRRWAAGLVAQLVLDFVNLA